MTMEINKILSLNPKAVTSHDYLGYDAKTRTVEHIISSNSTNCYGFRLLSSGYDDSYFAKCGVVLMNHMDGNTWMDEPYKPTEIIAGLSLSRRIEGDNVIAKTQFPDTELGNDLNYLYGNKLMKGWSVGWDIPDGLEDVIEMIGDVPTITKWTANEYSAVYRPANSDAVTLNNMLSNVKSRFLKRKLSKDYLIENAETELSELREAIKQLKEGAEFCTPKQLQDLKNELKSLVGENKKQTNETLFSIALKLNQLPGNLHNEILSKIPQLVDSTMRKYIGKVDHI